MSDTNGFTGEIRMLIDGELVEAQSGQRFENVNPATEGVLGEVADASAADMRRASEVSILFQHDPDLAFVTMIGKAALHENASETRDRWKPAYDVYFPSEADRASAIFVEVEIERMELWIRGVTPEPFGLRATVLERDAEGWRLIGG